jgi:type II secretory ATPase GspE/PulE/Tfp pilus assembly ATPase PilB-like protein
VDDEIRELVVQRSDAATIRQLAVKKRMVTLREDGKQKVIQGITTTQELLRVTGEDIL